MWRSTQNFEDTLDMRVYEAWGLTISLESLGQAVVRTIFDKEPAI